MDLPTGYYTVEVEKDGYIINYAEIFSAPYINFQYINITEILDAFEYRIVLSWGESPKDLDSHLLGIDNNEGTVFHVFYGDMIYYEDGDIVARLDRDDISSYGPEVITVTVFVEKDRDYIYYVYDFTNGGRKDSTALSSSAAKVEVFCQDKKLATYRVPYNEIGTIWNVFEIIDGELIETNVIS